MLKFVFVIFKALIQVSKVQITRKLTLLLSYFFNKTLAPPISCVVSFDDYCSNDFLHGGEVEVGRYGFA